MLFTASLNSSTRNASKSRRHAESKLPRSSLILSALAFAKRIAVLDMRGRLSRRAVVVAAPRLRPRHARRAPQGRVGRARSAPRHDRQRSQAPAHPSRRPAIGASIGLGFLPGALVLASVTVGVLAGVELLEPSVRRLTRGIYRKEGSGGRPAADRPAGISTSRFCRSCQRDKPRVSRAKSAVGAPAQFVSS